MVLGRLLFRTGAPALAALTAWAGVPFAAPAPDSSDLGRIQQACDAAKRLRITTAQGVVHQSDHLVVEPGGLLIPARGRPALIAAAGVRAPETRFPWAGIERLESERSNAGRAALLGGIIAAVPAAALLTHGTDAFSEGDQLNVIVAIALVGAAIGVGSILGSLTPDLHRIYPPTP